MRHIPPQIAYACGERRSKFFLEFFADWPNMCHCDGARVGRAIQLLPASTDWSEARTRLRTIASVSRQLSWRNLSKFSGLRHYSGALLGMGRPKIVRLMSTNQKWNFQNTGKQFSVERRIGASGSAVGVGSPVVSPASRLGDKQENETKGTGVQWWMFTCQSSWWRNSRSPSYELK